MERFFQVARALLPVLFLASMTGAEEPRRDRHGDPLPQGALSRLGTVQAHPHVEEIAFSADGKSLFSMSRNNVRHWDPKSGRVTRLIERRMPADAWLQVISADGRTAAILWRDRLEIRDVADDRLRHRVDVPPFESMTAFLISPNGSIVVVSLLGPDKAARTTLAVRTDSGKVDRWLGAALFRAVMSPNGERVAGMEVVDGARRICCRDATGKLLCRLPFEGRPVAFTADGAGLLTHDEEEGELVLVDAATGARRKVTLPRTARNPSAVFNPDGRLLAIDTSRDITLWDVNAGKAIHRWPGSARCLAFSPDGKRVAACDDLMRCWDVETGKSVWPDFGPLLGRSHDHVSFFSRPAGRLLTAWDEDARRLQVWDWTNGKLIFISPPVSGRTREATWLTPDGAQLHICTDERVLGWVIAGGKELRRLAPVPEDLIGNDWFVARESQDGNSVSLLIVERSENDSARRRAWLVRWDVAAASLLDRREIETRYRDFLRIAADGRHISDRDQLLDAVTGRRQTVAVAPLGFEVATPPEFSNDGHLAVGNVRPDFFDRTCELIVWEVATGQPLLRRPTGPRRMLQAALSPDNRWLAMPAEQSIELWDLATGKKAAALRHRTPDGLLDPTYYCLGLMFLPGGRLIAAYGDRTALIWKMPPETEQPPAQRITDGSWSDLGAPTSRTAQDAVWGLVNEPAKAVALLRERLKPVVAPANADLSPLIADLGDANFARREAAERRLHDLGHTIEKPLEAALARALNAEQRKRLQLLLDQCRSDGPSSTDERRAVRAVQALEQIGTPEAKALLTEWAKGTEAAFLTRAAEAALVRIQRK